MADLTSAFTRYIASLKAANPTKQDVTTLVAKDLATVRASVAGAAQLDDANTMYLAYIP